MITQVEMSDVTKEFIELLKYFDMSFISKIPENIVNKMKELSVGSRLVVKIDENKKLVDQPISNETKDLISILYYRYIATEEEKSKLINIWQFNDTLYQKEIQEKYNAENLFKDNNKNTNNSTKENLPKIIKNETIFEKIKSFFKKIFLDNKNNKR